MENLNPIQVVTSTEIKSYEENCSALVRRGYKLSSSNCYAYGEDGTITEIYQAVFAFPLAQAG